MNLSQLRMHIIAVILVMIACTRLVNLAVFGGLNLHWMLILSLMSTSIAASVYLGMLLGISSVLIISEAVRRANQYISVLKETRRRMMRNSGYTGY